MASITRVPNNTPTAGVPCGVSTTFFMNNVGDVDTYSHHLPFVFHDEYGVSPFALTPGESMMMKQGKKQSLDADSSDGDEWEEADVKGKQQSSVKKDDEELNFKMDMVGGGKEDAKLYLEDCTLMAKGVTKSDPQFWDAKDDRKTSRAKTFAKYKIDRIKAEMKNGVLKMLRFLRSRMRRGPK